MFDEQHITHDAVVASTVTFDDTADGITTDDDGLTIDWESVERVSLQSTDSFNDVPHGMAFDSNEFYRLEATVAKPIPQPYIMPSADSDVGETVWLKKPRAELQRAAWSLDNRPWTMDHPDTGLVASVDDIHGFWNDSYYNETGDDLKSYLHVPVGDDEAQAFIEDNTDVSVGFRNRVTPVEDYDKPVGGIGPDVDDDYERDIELDGYQTDMYFDHVASVEQGRCSGEDGCGITGDYPSRVDDASATNRSNECCSAGGYKGTVITNTNEDAQTSVLTQKNNMANDKFTHEGTWYAVPPEDNPDDEWKFPITSCDGEDSVDSAWHFAVREMGDISISWDTLKDRIRERASDLDCDMELSESDAMDVDVSVDSFDETHLPEITMTDCGCDSGGMDINFDDLSADVALDKIAAENDSIADELTELRDKASVAEDAADELDTDIEQVTDRAALLEDRVEELQETVDELQRPKMEEDAEVIIEATDRFGDSVEDVIESCDADPDVVAEKRELVEDLASTTDSKTANGTSEPEDDITVDDGPAVTPWE